MRRWLTLLTLIAAGEMVFALPFQTARFFRPTLLEAFSLTNTQLGDLFAAYGITAMLCYFPGGMLADRFSARGLLTASLAATAVGGLVMMQYPSPEKMALLYAFWGITSILLLWGALIKATRDWGGRHEQGLAFGMLDAGRGLMAAGAAFIALRVFTAALGTNELDNASRQAAFADVILTYTVLTLVVAVLAWFLIPPSASSVRSNPLQGAKTVLGRPVLWAQAGIVVAAYCGYKGVDNYSLYANQVLGYSEVEAAELSAWGAYIRPAGALFAGFMADRFSASRGALTAFAAMLIGYVVIAMSAPSSSLAIVIFANLFVTYFAVCGLRAIYFALLEENKTPAAVTGAATGLVSVIGFTPEIFFAPITGRILDANPGLVGHQHYFWFMAGVAVLGLLATIVLIVLNRTHNPWQRPEDDAATEQGA